MDDMDNGTALQMSELRSELQMVQRDLHKMAMDIAVMKTREGAYKVLLVVSILMNAVTIAFLFFKT